MLSFLEFIAVAMFICFAILGSIFLVSAVTLLILIALYYLAYGVGTVFSCYY